MKKIFPLSFLLAIAALVVTTGCSNEKLDKDVVQQSYVHQYGLSVSKADWLSRGSNGQVISTLKNGVTVVKNYRNHTLDGKVTYSFPHRKTIATTLSYQNGILIDKTEHFSSGVPAKKSEFLADNNEKITNWYPSGTPQSIELYANDRLISGEYFSQNNEQVSTVANGSGTRTNYNDLGLLDSHDLIEAGVMVMKTSYFSTGTPQAETPFVNGLIDGERKTYNSDGSPSSIEQWINGRQEGITTFFNNGAVYAKVPYVNNKKHGVEHRYEEGNVVEAITWNSGERHGPTYHYIAGIVSTEWFYQNKPVSKFYYEEKMAKKF